MKCQTCPRDNAEPRLIEVPNQSAKVQNSAEAKLPVVYEQVYLCDECIKARDDVLCLTY